ncbi:MAG: prepilin-type N-terminal cleavage/methylation domain-containing protein [Phycisphaerales bacterium]|nr:prepilin-type N-terminal cleavage/methylation domain-containing protein [Phycisphaerales bacterium]
MRRQAFTLIELLVVVAVVALLLGILVPALGRARAMAQASGCMSNIKQLGLGLQMYVQDHKDRLPQVRVEGFGGTEPVQPPSGQNIGALFGGVKGTLPFFGINAIGAERRPLNAYVYDGEIPRDDAIEAGDFDLEVYRSPADAGTADPFVTSLGLDTTSMYDLLGSSYNLNDHALDTVAGVEVYPTLIPVDGGKMPRVRDTTKTWLCATHPIYNYEDDQDRGQKWYSSSVEATVLYVDGHAEMMVKVPDTRHESDVRKKNSNARFTYLPEPRWLDQFDAGR